MSICAAGTPVAFRLGGAYVYMSIHSTTALSQLAVDRWWIGWVDTEHTTLFDVRVHLGKLNKVVGNESGTTNSGLGVGMLGQAKCRYLANSCHPFAYSYSCIISYGQAIHKHGRATWGAPTYAPWLYASW